jgi:hypothetical protein
VQGRLLNQNLEYTIRSNCASSGRPIEIGVDSDLNIRTMTQGAAPMYSMALINTERMKEKSIIDVF